ncbi:MAG: nitrilase-related carbon-nitrogen hydrolase [Oscillospiraceae bacterium]
MRKFKVALAQMNSTFDIETNINTILDLAKEGAIEGCEMVCFPEASITGYRVLGAEAIGIDRQSPQLDRLSEFAQCKKIDILAGFIEKAGRALHITHALLAADGRKEFYRKTHLGQREGQVFSQGEELSVFKGSNGTVFGMELCVETHFPDVTQTLALKGAQIIFAPFAVPKKAGDRHSIWEKYIPARSYDNRVYFGVCNQCGDCGRTEFAGGCMAYSPSGDEIGASFTDKNSLLIFEFDEAEYDRFHTPQPDKMGERYYPAQKRTELYL